MQKNTTPQAEIVATKCRALAATRVKSTSTVFHDHFPTRKLKLPSVLCVSTERACQRTLLTFPGEGS